MTATSWDDDGRRDGQHFGEYTPNHASMLPSTPLSIRRTTPAPCTEAIYGLFPCHEPDRLPQDWGNGMTVHGAGTRIGRNGTHDEHAGLLSGSDSRTISASVSTMHSDMTSARGAGFIAAVHAPPSHQAAFGSLAQSPFSIARHIDKCPPSLDHPPHLEFKAET